MINYKKEQITVDKKVSITCDVCKKTYNVEDYEEAQEVFHIEEVVGYSSIFGDGLIVELDICQHCLKEKLGQFLRIRER